MFSAILAVALIGGGDAAAFGKHGCCGGGCSGYSCMGGYGCCGGKHHGGHGCCGGYSCMGGYGCCGGKHHKHHGCCGGCYGYYGCCGGYSCMGGYGGWYGGCYGGCMGGFGGCYGVGGIGGIGGTVLPTTTTPATTTPAHTSSQAAPATIVVNVPADAKVTVDGEPTTSTSARRVYVSPSLEAGAEFHYTLQAEFNQDGKTISVKKMVTVRAGQETEVNLDATDASSVASR